MFIIFADIYFRYDCHVSLYSPIIDYHAPRRLRVTPHMPHDDCARLSLSAYIALRAVAVDAITPYAMI